ncbi:GntR family transcriptional regulator [uncultured Amnibacterium sp.]|uniref:GntR family transcriptional regulator n=1 Tax=uncultured Amnibacterium sp. TaxID=1631851 RepID=UPI0035CBC456
MTDGDTIRARIERALGSRIAAGVVPVGTLLSVPALAEEFRVSATPVREAVLELQRRGFVEPSRNRGFVVTAVDPSHAEHVAAVRELLEPPAMRALAALRPDLADARDAARRIADSADAGELEAYLEEDRRFHIELTALAGNPMLTAVVDDLRRRTRLPGLAALVGSQELAASAAEHGDLLDAIEAGDGDSAEAVMRHHIGHTTGWWAGVPE